MIAINGFVWDTMANKTKGRVKKKDTECKCLICDAERTPGRRGLCLFHWNQFTYRRSLRKRGKERRDYEMKLQHLGKLLESVRGKHSKRVSEFDV